MANRIKGITVEIVTLVPLPEIEYVCAAFSEADTTASGVQLREVFFRLNIRMNIKPPKFDDFRQHLINRKGVEIIKPLLWGIGNGRICVFSHDIGNIFKHLKRKHIQI